MNIRSLYCIILVLILSASSAIGQETVFALLKNDLRLADNYFENRDYRNALMLYLNVAKKNPSKEVELKIARSYHFLKQYHQAVAVYEKHTSNNKLPVPDMLYYAESQSGISNYVKAIESYQDYLSRVPDDERIQKKIWRLNNVQFLYEDSMHYDVRPVGFNTEYGELCPVPYRNGLVFMSNRREVQPIEKLDASLHAPFYKVYFSTIVPDSSHLQMPNYERPVVFSKQFNSKFHAGPLAFYDRQTKMVFASTSEKAGRGAGRTLQLYFAENNGDHWRITAFPHNSKAYSLSDPSISEDGMVLFFSSDIKGGFGGKDIYRSEFKNGEWTKPVNLGETINTVQDEVFPFYHRHALYFSSNGHPGLGGLDIFKTELDNESFTEPQNVGYPLNTNYDDFGIVIDSLDSHGYFSSNRKTGGYNDDIYEFDMNLQTYPLEIQGVMKFKEHSWSDTLALKIMPHAKIYLIDNIRDVIVHESTCDANGKFSMLIPHYSKYKIKVVGEDKDENIVSLEIPKHKKANNQHEIVIVKDAFKSH